MPVKRRVGRPRKKAVKRRTTTTRKKKATPKKRKRDYKKEYARDQKKRIKYRSGLNKEARKRKIYGKRRAMGKDLSHTKSGKLVLEKSSKNRARNGMKKGRPKSIRTNTRK